MQTKSSIYVHRPTTTDTMLADMRFAHIVIRKEAELDALVASGAIVDYSLEACEPEPDGSRSIMCFMNTKTAPYVGKLVLNDA